VNRLITVNDVALYLKTAPTPAYETHIDTAHALVAAVILTPTLDRRSVSERHKLKYDSELIELRDGPIALVDSVTSNGTALDLNDLVIGYWTIQYPDGFRRGDQIDVVYRAGYRKPEASDDPEIPDLITRALILAAEQIFSTPNTDIVYEKIGDYTRQTAAGVPGRQETSTLDPRTVTLLRPFRRPQL